MNKSVPYNKSNIINRRDNWCYIITENSSQTFPKLILRVYSGIFLVQNL